MEARGTAQTEARAIARCVRGCATDDQYVELIEKIATAIAAKNAELAAAEHMLELSKATTEAVLERAERAEAQLAEANKALEPFAARAGLIDGKWLDHETHWSPAYGSTEITIGDLRAARRALTGGQEDG